VDALNSDKQKETIVLEYYEDDFCKMWAYQKFIKKHIKLKNKLPARVLKVYFDIFDKTTFDFKHAKENFLSNAQKKVIDDIKKYKQTFSFRIHRQNKPIRKSRKIASNSNVLVPMPLNFDFANSAAFDADSENNKTSADFIERYYRGLKNVEKIDELLGDKTMLIDHAAKELRSYLDEKHNKNGDGYPTYYKQTIIIGLILVSFGLLHDKENWELSNSKFKVYTAYLNKSVEYQFKQPTSNTKSKGN